MDAQLSLTENQVTHLIALTDKGKENFPAGYRYIYSLIQDSDQVDDGTKFWFQQASEINGGKKGSLSS